jgi:hypothetical protein
MHRLTAGRATLRGAMSAVHAGDESRESLAIVGTLSEDFDCHPGITYGQAN